MGYSINGTGPGHTVLYSDGAQVLQSGLPVPGAFDYTELFTHINPNADRLLYIRYIFKPRKMRYFFWHGIRDTGWGIVKWGEFMLFSPGHPAEAVLRSPFIDLGTEAGDGRPKVIKGLHWDADLPLGAKLQRARAPAIRWIRSIRSTIARAMRLQKTDGKAHPRCCVVPSIRRWSSAMIGAHGAMFTRIRVKYFSRKVRAATCSWR